MDLIYKIIYEKMELSTLVHTQSTKNCTEHRTQYTIQYTYSIEYTTIIITIFVPFGTLYFCKIHCILSKYTVFCKFQLFVPNAIFFSKKKIQCICQIQSYRFKTQSENSVFCKKYSRLQNKNKYSSLYECTKYRTDAEIR